MTVSTGRSAPLKDHFVVSWTATMVVKLEFLWMGGVPRRHDRPELGCFRGSRAHNASIANLNSNAS